ncbi:hypothetical protein [Bradyrhizobium sp. LCT2]|uniref:hypothetical protein n=1 Tax=Bradyrhizobium sp. LCT2 TaxID=2493093 RepID=UPI001374DF2D|nr:hypothetical protein [Bradyrhizobium sp. LCT2]
MPPDVITTRIDGWFGGPDNMPSEVAKVIARAMPQPDEVEVIRARMLARHRNVLGHV